ncbi:beta-1,4 N-acetylgalactosaminyltransferase 2-like [Hemiscyllium ocellatum]|uniref:beta-1,4 N-acetylgalactosaminyltransferase 2-like n=1 Tax=Hemiscyllium ocellatum TaxID=170820 RepID=UPI002966026F|nr:beta-1,4 N-acetylgalactosaminyltransferase 2-like [Hemiscyllium ocellatum]
MPRQRQAQTAATIRGACGPRQQQQSGVSVWTRQEQQSGVSVGPRTYGKTECSCPALEPEMVLHDFENVYIQKDILSVKKRRRLQYEQHKKRTESIMKNIIIAEPNSPLSYPIQGVEVKLKAIQGLFNAIVETSDGLLNGVGKNELTITSPSLEIVNSILKHVTYTSIKYQIEAADLVHFQFEEHTAVFPVIIRQPQIPRLFDPGPDSNINSLVTIVTKTFLRYHKLRILINSIRNFYPEITIIIADDSETPEKIEGPHIEQYMMPFGKGWFAGRNLAASQVTTKYLLWVDEDFLFTEETKLEKLVDVLEKTNLDVVGASVSGSRFQFKLWYEKGNDDGDCLFSQFGSFHALDGFPHCVVTSLVVNFFLARTQKVWSVGFDPRLSRVAHPEFFIDGLGSLLVGSCNDVHIGHQKKVKQTQESLKDVERRYATFRHANKRQFKSRLALVHFKNWLKCYAQYKH